MLRATVDKTRISYQTILSFYRTYSSSPSLLPSLSVDRMLITGATHLSLRQPTQSKADAQKPSHFSGDRPSCHITTTYLNRPSVNQQLCLRHTNARARACTCTIRPNLQKSLLRQCEFTASSQMIFTALLAKPSLSAC